MRLKSHFSGFPDTRAPEKYPEFVEKSDWQPPKQGRDLETFISSVESESHICYHLFVSSPPPPNLYVIHCGHITSNHAFRFL